MAETFYVATEITYAPTLERLPMDPNPDGDIQTSIALGQQLSPGNLSNQPYVEHSAMWALYNGAGSGRKITIANLVVNPLQGRTGTAAQAWGIQRLSAMSGGEDVSSEVSPLDTNNSPIPSQVLFRDGPSVTTTGGVLRRTLDLPFLNATRAYAFPTYRNAGYNDSLVSTQRTLTDCQGQVLREGEGLGILTTGATGRENYVLAIQAFITISGQTYMFRKLVQTSAWDAMLGIFNGVGSGVVVTVRDINVAEVATDATTALRRYELGTISGMHPNSKGKRLTPAKLDSTSNDLPDQIVAALRPGVIQIGKDSGLLPTRPNNYPLRRWNSAVNGVGPGVACLIQGQRFLGEVADFSSAIGTGFVLNEGEGIAVFQKESFDSWGSGYWLTCSFYVETVGGQQISPVIGSSIIRGATT
jgi:hypothetical protein